MSIRLLLAAIVAAAAIAVLGYLVRMTQGIDADAHQARLALIREINDLDVQLNRITVQARFTSIAQAGDDRGRVTNRLGEVLEIIGQPGDGLGGLDARVDATVAEFRTTIEDKFVLAFDFEARNTIINQRMISSLDAVPLYAEVLQGLADPATKDPLREVLSPLKAEMLTLAVTPTPTNEPQIRALSDSLGKLVEAQPEPVKEAAQRVRTAIDEVLAEKKDLSARLNDFLDRPTDLRLKDVEQAYQDWYEYEAQIADQYRLYLGGYAAVLLLVLALLGLRLSRSYRDLDRANASLKDANENLEGQVHARTKDLSSALTELRASQTQLVQSEKMASLGQMVAGVAHEINTPLGYARSNAEIVRSSLTDIRTLCGAQTHALKLMTSGEAKDEEIAAALESAYALGESLQPEQLGEDLDNLLSDTDHGLKQIAELVGSLKDFSRVDRSRADLFNVNDGIESALKIANNHLKHKVEVVRQFGKLPEIECAPSQLNQVFLNLFTNAAQAIEGQGKIFIHTAAEPDCVAIRVLDTGCGMPEEVRKRIFEPFYTTKPVGKGTGLGLSIVFRIIEDHGGKIDVRSTPGKGSEFIVKLPYKQKSAQNDAAAPQLAAA